MTDYRKNPYTGRPDLVATKAEEIEGLAVVARTGNWADLVGEPVLPGVATEYQGALAETALQPTGDGSGLRNMTKAQVGLGNVDNTADADKPISTAMHAALATYNVNQTAGVDNTGTTECAAALQAAIDYATAQGFTAIASGTYKVGSKVVLKDYTDFSHSTFNVIGSPPVAVEISTGSAADPTDILWHKRILLPEIINVDKPSTGWAGQGIGVRVVNTYSCTIINRHVQGFDTGLHLTAYSTGNVYNNIDPGHLDNNKRNIVAVSGNSGGWVNENNFFGGRFSHNSGEGTNVTGVRQIQLSDSTNLLNNNRFWGVSVEGSVSEYTVENYGNYNLFDSCRWEGAPKIHWGSTGSGRGCNNTVRGGYNAFNIVYTTDAGAVRNNHHGTYSTRLDGGINDDGVLSLKNSASSAKPLLVGLDATGDLNNITSSNYAVMLSSQSLRGKHAADAYPRVKMDFSAGRVYLGDGATDPTLYLAKSGTGLKVNGGPLYTSDGTMIGQQALGITDAPTFSNVKLTGVAAAQIPFPVAATVTVGPELATPGTWAGYTAQSGWTIADPQTIATAAGTGNGVITPIATLLADHSYQVTYTIDSISGGSVRAYVGGNYGTARNAPGTYTEVIARGASTNTGVYALGTTTAAISAFSVKEAVSASALSSDSGLTWDNTTKTLSATHINITSLPSYASNAAAVTGGLAVGSLYRQGDFVAVVH